MRTNELEYISLVDLGLAYRKAKVDAYYSSVLVRSEFLDYEQDLFSNLRRMQRRLIRKPDAITLGGWTLMPKCISLCDDVQGIVHSCPHDRWAAILQSGKQKAEFRLMAQPSVEFHILSALWMLKVGHLYDAKLGDSAYGNRLRCKQDGSVNPLSLGSFEPYLKPFRDWRDNGIGALSSAVASGKKVVAVTADVSSFYHELNPRFMLDKDFLETIELNLISENVLLTEVFIQALERWALNTPLEKGLPVGLPASGLVANMALIELDHVLEREVIPIYYGRYVDDIMLAMENTSDFKTQEEVLHWLIKRSNGLLKWSDKYQQEVSFIPSYLSGSKIVFSNKKNKVFLINGESGKAFIDSIAHNVHQRASEWRALPDLPENPEHIATEIVEATHKDGSAADNLRKADSLSLRRAGFAIKLRDFEAYERDLSPDTWVEHRHAFLRAFIQHVLVLPKFFDLADYLPRVIRIATACEDFVLLRKILDSLFKIVDQVSNSCETTIKSCPDSLRPESATIVAKWNEHLKRIVVDSIKASFPYHLTQTGARIWRTHFSGDTNLSLMLGIELTPVILKACQRELFFHDLAHLPFRFIGLPREFACWQHLPQKRDIAKQFDPEKLLPSVVISGIQTVVNLMRCGGKNGIPLGLLFATRPLSIQELYLLHPSPYATTSLQQLSQAIQALRGFSIEKAMPCIENNGILQIPFGRQSGKYRIAVASWKTEIKSWTASIEKKSDPDLSRYSRLVRLMNEVLGCFTPIDYLILPEVAVPPRWFMRIAHKLRGRGIALISGVEYLHDRRHRVRNQVWAALPHDGLGFPSLALYRQDKQRPAFLEEKELFRIAGAVLQPQKAWQTPPVLRHGSFQFAFLICSELTNIAYRSALRGRIDALFVPEWNQDTETFNALVESAALDIHAYIIQCNDRQYGDSRIRVPHKDSWMRDLVRLKGGKNDYFVVGEIDIISLRAFQTSHRSPCGPFKPVPDGFSIAFERQTLAQTDEEQRDK